MRMITALMMVTLAASIATGEETRQASGVKVGEVTPTEAIVWVRLTANAERNKDGLVMKGGGDMSVPADVNVGALEGACPGAKGRVRVVYGRAGRKLSPPTAWVDVDASTDFSHQFHLTGLQPGTAYGFLIETAGPGGQVRHGKLRGQFETAPPPDKYADVTFTVITGQMYRDMDRPDGFHIYKAMATLKPKFIVPTGDTVYYDSEAPRAKTPALARYHWHRMYSLPTLVRFHRNVPGYWEKDDHDTVVNDCWPTMAGGRITKMLPLTFERGRQIFREQVPMGEKTYRTYRWGKDLQIWLVEGRDFRSPNKMKDGPEKTIWGAEQRLWLKETLLASDADWKVLISPTPIVGPDRKSKADNHANAAFAFEGNEFREWVKKNMPGNFFVACGDRHWQYHSVHPESGVHEFSCGPASDQHASGTPGENEAYHRFHRVKGGFLSVASSKAGNESTIAFRFHGVDGKVGYEYTDSVSYP